MNDDIATCRRASIIAFILGLAFLLAGTLCRADSGSHLEALVEADERWLDEQCGGLCAPMTDDELQEELFNLSRAHKMGAKK